MKQFDVAPIGSDVTIGTLLATWEDGTREWLENLDEPSEEAMVWQPFPNAPSIGGIMLHMACCDLYWIKNFVRGEELDADHPAVAYDAQLDQDNVSWPMAPHQPFAWYREVLESTRRQVVELILQEPNVERVFQRRSSTATFRWIVAHLIEHDSYHGGQCVLLHSMWQNRPSV